MNQLYISVAAIGGLILLLGLVSNLVKARLWVSEPLVALVVGAALGPHGFGLLDSILSVFVAGVAFNMVVHSDRAEQQEHVQDVAESGAPALIGGLSGLLAGAGTAGVQAAFIITLPALLLNGLILLLALRTHRPDIAAALASSEALR